MRSTAVKIARTATGMTISVKGAGEVDFDTRDASAACNEEARLIGWEQRFKTAALPKKTNSEKFAAIKRLVEHYRTKTDEWSLRPQVSDDEVLLLQTIKKLFPMRSAADIRTRLEKLPAEARH